MAWIICNCILCYPYFSRPWYTHTAPELCMYHCSFGWYLYLPAWARGYPPPAPKFSLPPGSWAVWGPGRAAGRLISVSLKLIIHVYFKLLNRMLLGKRDKDADANQVVHGVNQLQHLWVVVEINEFDSSEWVIEFTIEVTAVLNLENLQSLFAEELHCCSREDDQYN